MASQYCQPSDLVATGINPVALQDIPMSQQTASCQQASEMADSYMRGRYALPLSAWGQDVVIRTAHIAIYLLMTARGYDGSAGGGADNLIRLNFEDAIRWFEGIQRQNVHPDVTPAVAQPGDPVHDLPQVITNQPRMWQQFNSKGRQVIS